MSEKDFLAINTIRTLAVRQHPIPACPSISESYPAMAGFPNNLTMMAIARR